MREKIEMVDLQPEQRERTLNCMKKLYQSLEFFYQLVNDDKLSEENVRTHMGLYESYFTELSDILGYDSAIAEERRSRYTEIRTLREQLQASLTERSTQANGGLENMINWEGKDKDLLALIKYIAEEDKLEKVLENPQVIKTPVVRNGKQSTLGYQPDIWKTWK